MRGAGCTAIPCAELTHPDIPVGPTVDDFANALADHPLLDATTPVDVTLGGYSGKYMDLQLPADLDACTDAHIYRPWEPGDLRPGPVQRWHLWILDVDGIRVVVQPMTTQARRAEHQAELQAIVDSIQIEP